MSRAKGNKAEDLACNFLSENGFHIIERNFYSRFGEIDIIAIKDEILHFIEVKSGIDYESAIQNITPKKLSRFIKTTHVYLKKNIISSDFMIDAILITPKKIWYVENVTI